MHRYRDVFDSNARWVRERRAQDPDFFHRLAQGQHPDFLFIGCSDARVPPSELMGLDPGDVFVHRNIANLVVNTDLNAQSVLQYGVEVLGARYVVVCGHYGCGGVAAAMEHRDMGLLNGWLREVRDVYRLHRRELDAIPDLPSRYRRLVELNVREQCTNVLKTAVIQRNILRTGRPSVHGWVYDLEDGLLRDLEIPYREILDEIREVYALDD